MGSGVVNRDWFYKLASDLQDERVQAAISLIKELSSLSLPEDAGEWSYVLKRLISGLASSRNSARLGFSLCLTEVVNLALNMDDAAPAELVSIDGFLDLLSSTLSLVGSNGNSEANKQLKGKEERGLLFGKMFGLQALLNEPVFTNVFLEGQDERRVSEFAIRFMDELAQLAIRKTWLREPCLFTLFQTVQKLLPFADSRTIGSIFSLLDQYQLTLTNEGLAVYLLVLHTGAINNQSICASFSLSSKGWKSNDPLARGNLPLLSQVLRDSTVSQNEEESIPSLSPKASNWNPRLHFVWDILLPIIMQERQNSLGAAGKGKPVSKKRKKEKEKVSDIEFPEFWQMAVDETFFNEKASNERKFLGFLIFQKTLELAPSHLLPCCFSQNLMRSLINQSTDSKRLLYKISHKALNKIVEICEKDSSNKLLPCLDAVLFGPHGSTNFDKLTRSKTVTKLIGVPNLTPTTLSDLFSTLSSHLIEATGQEKQQVQFVLDTLLHVVRSNRSALTNDLIVNPLLEPIVELAFFFTGDENINNLAKERLYSILSELTNSQENTCSAQYYVLNIILEKESAGKDLVNPLDDSLGEVRSNGFKVLETVSSHVENPQLQGLESLLSMCLLQLYSGETDSISIIEELCAFYSEIDNESTSLIGITEILLSLLAQKKALLRKLSLYVWQQSIEKINEQELKILLDVLHARENKQGFAQLFEGADDFELEEGENIDEDEDEDEEAIQKENEGNSSPSSSDSSTVSESDEEDKDDNEGDVAKIDKKATSALAKALNLPDNIVNDKGEVDLNQWESDSSDGVKDEEEDESMDDEKMMELDDQLSLIFKSRKEALSHISTGNERKLEAKESREHVIAFKHRIVDMLEIFVKYVEKLTSTDVSHTEQQKARVPLSLRNLLLFIEPMITCIKQTTDRALADRVAKLLKTKIYKIRISAFHNLEDSEYLLNMLNCVHKNLLASKPGQHQSLYYSLCSTSSLFLAKLLFESSIEDSNAVYSQLIDLYSETMKQWTFKGKFGPNVFIDFLNWLSSRKQTTQP